MVQQIQAYPLLAGARGRQPRDVEAVVDAILRLSQLAVDFPQLQEIDINPLIVQDAGKGCVAVDVKMVLEEVV
jgi:succinyl-CoA synthetase beta subunit